MYAQNENIKDDPDTFPSNTNIKNINSIFENQLGSYDVFVLLKVRPHQIHYTLHKVEPKTNGLNSYDQEHCLINMNRLKPHPKYWERDEWKQLQG